jgi:hypothetical protein
MPILQRARFSKRICPNLEAKHPHAESKQNPSRKSGDPHTAVAGKRKTELQNHLQVLIWYRLVSRRDSGTAITQLSE